MIQRYAISFTADLVMVSALAAMAKFGSGARGILSSDTAMFRAQDKS
jgi:hypothetical protein